MNTQNSTTAGLQKPIQDLDQVIKQVAAKGYGFRDLVHQMVQSNPFLSK